MVGSMVFKALRNTQALTSSLMFMQCIASDPETRPLFLKAQLPLWVFPLIDTKEESEVYEYMRSAGLALLGRLCQVSFGIICICNLQNLQYMYDSRLLRIPALRNVLLSKGLMQIYPLSLSGERSMDSGVASDESSRRELCSCDGRWQPDVQGRKSKNIK